MPLSVVPRSLISRSAYSDSPLDAAICVGNNGCVADFALRLRALLRLMALCSKACTVYCTLYSDIPLRCSWTLQVPAVREGDTLQPYNPRAPNPFGTSHGTSGATNGSSPPPPPLPRPVVSFSTRNTAPECSSLPPFFSVSTHLSE